MQLIADAEDVLKAVELIAALSVGVFLILLIIVGLSHPNQAISSMVRANVLEVAVGVIIGVVVSIIILVLGMIDKYAG
jgi:hypothetical protein